MAKIWGCAAPLLGIEWKMAAFSKQFFDQNLKATLLALLFILGFHLFRKLRSRLSRGSSIVTAANSPLPGSASRSPDSQSAIQDIVSEADLKFLIENLDGNFNETDRWEGVINKRNNLLFYNAKCCKPKEGPLKYLSVTVFENCSPKTLRDFYMDNEYRKQWDKTIVEHEQLQVDKTNGIEIGCTIKKFPLLTPREYVLAWKLWEGKDKTFYCFIKECEHPLAPRQRKYVHVGYFRSGWRIRKVPGRDACEIKMFHQEDAGLNVVMAKLAFAKGIWSYVCKMDNALRKYSPVSHPQMTPVASALTLLQKVPPALDMTDMTSCQATPGATTAHRQFRGASKERTLSRRPTKILLANGLLILGGAICLSRGHSALGAKVAMAYILTKLRKRGASSRQNSESQGT
ncbi:hypothetical protein SLE2022_380130 [Rubroshorea leprosula]